MTELKKFKRVVLKLSGEALAGEKGFGIDPTVVYALAKQIKAVVETGVEVAIVNGGGNFKGAALGVILGAVIMVVGYSLGRAFIYSTPHYAYIKLPYQILQAAVGAVGGLVLCFKAGLLERFDKMFRK